MDNQRLLSHLSNEQIFSFLAINARYSLARRCPQSRGWNRKFPFHLKKLSISIQAGRGLQANLDGLEWKFEAFRDKNVITLPSGKKKEFDCDGPQRMLKYYVGRSEKIDELFVELIRGNSNKTQKPFCIFNYFQNIKLKKLSLHALDDRWYDFDSENLGRYKLQTELFILEVGYFSDDSLAINFPFAKVSILRDFCGDSYDFTNKCEDFKGGNHSIGTEYQARLIASFHWSYLKDMLYTKVKYREGICGMCVPINSKTELFITGSEAEFSNLCVHSFRFSATIQKADLSVSYQEMSVREKLRYWNHKRRHFVLEKLIKFEMPFATKWHDLNMRREQDLFNLMRCYRVLVPMILSEIVILFLLVMALQTHFSLSPLITLIPLLSVFLVLTYFYSRSWYLEKKDSYIPVMPPCTWQ